MTSVLTRAKAKQNDLDEALTKAVLKGNSAKVIKCIMKGANVRCKDKVGNTLLHKATNPKIIHLLIRHGADIDAKNLSGRTPLMQSVTSKKNKEQKERRINVILKGGDAHHLSLSTKISELIIIEFLKRKANVNVADRYGKTPLHAYLKVSECNISIILIMLDHGANIHAQTGIGSTLLHAAVSNPRCSLDVIKLLLVRGVNPNIASLSGETPLHNVLDSNFCKLEVVQMLLHYGADVSVRDGHGYTPLHFAVNNPLCNYEIIKEILMQDRSIVNKQDNQTGCTPLHVVLSFGKLKKKLEIIELLLLQNVLVNARDRRSFSHLHVAVDNILCHEKAISILIKYGANVNARNEEGQTPLHFAFKKIVNFNVVMELINFGADISMTDYNGVTPLFYAISNPSFKISHLTHLLLMCKGIDDSLCWTEKTEDILSLSFSLGKFDLTRVLLKYMLLKSYLNTQNHLFTKTLKHFCRWEITEINMLRTLFLFLSDCMDEINAMLCDKLLGHSVTFYNVMKADVFRLSHNQNSRNLILNTFIDRLIRNCYPLYKDLSPNFTHEYISKGLDTVVVYAKNRISTNKIILDQHSVQYLASYLTKEDLLNLTAAYSNSYCGPNKGKESEMESAYLPLCKSTTMTLELDFEKLMELKVQQLSCVEIDHLSGSVRISPNGGRVIKTSLLQPTFPEDNQRVLRRSKRILERTLSFGDISVPENKSKLRKSFPLPNLQINTPTRKPRRKSVQCYAASLSIKSFKI